MQTTGKTALAPLLVVLGPTASGKTSLAVALARILDGEVISADSRQVYRGMDLGTGKDLDEYRTGGTPVVCHLVDVAEAGEEYNIFRYQQEFDRIYADLSRRGKVPVLCGGSGLYLSAALGRKTFREVPPDTVLRAELAEKSDAELADLLSSFGPLHNHTDTETRERCLRALEILFFEREHPDPGREMPPPLLLGIRFEAEDLRQRIRVRLEERLRQGMAEEVRNLLGRGLQPEQLLYYGLEYKFLTRYVLGEISYAEMDEGLYHAICQFAKRQRTWFRKMEKEGYRILWMDGNLPLEDKIDLSVNAWNAHKEHFRKFAQEGRA